MRNEVPKFKLDADTYTVLKGITCVRNAIKAFREIVTDNPDQVRAGVAVAVWELNKAREAVKALTDGTVESVLKQIRDVPGHLKDVVDLETYLNKFKNEITQFLMDYARQIEEENKLTATTEKISFQGMSSEEAAQGLRPLVERLKSSNEMALKNHYAVHTEDKTQLPFLSEASSVTSRDVMGRQFSIALETVPKDLRPVAQKLNLKFAEMKERNSMWMRDPVYRRNATQMLANAFAREDRHLSLNRSNTRAASARLSRDMGRV